MTAFVIYDHPSDCPAHWVVRAWRVVTISGMITTVPARFSCAFDTLEEARAALPKGLTNMGNALENDPVIAEVWM